MRYNNNNTILSLRKLSIGGPTSVGGASVRVGKALCFNGDARG